MITQRMVSKEELEAVDISGRDVFKHRYNIMLSDLNENEKKIEEIYLNHYKEAQTDFGHYFRNLYRMIKLVDETDFFYDQSKVSKKEIFEIKYRYTSIIRAQISDYELLWIFYNCLSENGIKKFKPLVEKYALFKNIPVSLITSESHISMYSKNAFSPTTGLHSNSTDI